jgi:hypothetical protein
MQPTLFALKRAYQAARNALEILLQRRACPVVPIVLNCIGARFFLPVFLLLAFLPGSASPLSSA